jgi:hypothetical protein
MRVRTLLLTFLALAAAARPAPADDPRPVLRIEGREETFGLLCCPQHALAYYAVELMSDGSLRAAIDGYPGTLNPQGAPTFQLFAGGIDRARLEAFRRLFVEARIGHQTACELQPRTAFLFFASASAPPVQRLTWFGKAPRRNAFQMDHGPACPTPVQEIASRLRDAFRALIEAGNADAAIR